MTTTPAPFISRTGPWNGTDAAKPGRENSPRDAGPRRPADTATGVGTGATGGHWVIEDSIFRYNTSDGLDLLYTRVGDSQIDIRRTRAYGNAGDQIKVNGDTSIENSLAVSQCSFFEGQSFTYNVDPCRAGDRLWP